MATDSTSVQHEVGLSSDKVNHSLADVGHDNDHSSEKVSHSSTDVGHFPADYGNSIADMQLTFIL